MRGEPGFFDVDERLKRLSDLGDQLLAFTAAVDFEMFRPELTRALAYSDGSQGGRPPFDPVMMFKILVIQAANALSDERAEFLINDRLSFMRFLGLSLSDRVPDARTIWLFREKLTGTIRNPVSRPVGGSYEEPVLEHDCELRFRLAPFPWRHFPLACGLMQDDVRDQHI